MFLKSSAFTDGTDIPSKFTGEGRNISPELSWGDIPNTCKELALLCEDPDAPIREGKDHPFVHWLMYNISTEETSIHEDLPQDRVLTSPFHVYQGVNSFNKVGYGGPMPPEGHGVHHYHFTLYALSTELHLEPGLSQKEVMPLINRYCIETANLVGTYERPLRRTDVSKSENKSKESDQVAHP